MAPSPSVSTIVAQIAIQERAAGSATKVSLDALTTALVELGFDHGVVVEAVRDAVHEGAVRKTKTGSIQVIG